VSFFDKIIGKIFQAHSETDKISLTEPLHRHEHHKRSYLEWLTRGDYEYMVADIFDAYKLRKGKNDATSSIYLYESAQANGFAINCADFSYSAEEYRNFFDYLKERVLGLDYILQFSERKIADKGDYVETLEKYYLKPPINVQNPQELFNQLYGNITIDYIIADDSPRYIKFLCTVYHDRLYSKPLPFDKLVDYLFEIDSK